MIDLKVKISSFVNRVLRYFIWSTLLSFSVCFILFIGNLFAGVKASIGIYIELFSIFDIALTILLSIYNSHKLFVPLSKPLIFKLDSARIERARMENRRKKRKSNKKVS